MYCTNCGAGEQLSKTYCRKCGKWIGSAPPEERLTVMIVFNGLSALFGVIAAIALFMTYLDNSSAKWSIHLALTFCSIIAVYQTLSFLFALNMRRRIKHGQRVNENELRESQATSELPPADASNFIPITSVTENTTQLLERER